MARNALKGARNILRSMTDEERRNCLSRGGAESTDPEERNRESVEELKLALAVMRKDYEKLRDKHETMVVSFEKAQEELVGEKSRRKTAETKVTSLSSKLEVVEERLKEQISKVVVPEREGPTSDQPNDGERTSEFEIRRALASARSASVQQLAQSSRESWQRSAETERGREDVSERRRAFFRRQNDERKTMLLTEGKDEEDRREKVSLEKKNGFAKNRWGTGRLNEESSTATLSSSVS